MTGVAADPLLPAGTELLGFVEALLTGADDELTRARLDLHEVGGADSVVRAAAVVGNFEMMNRLVDATGVPIGSSMRPIAAELGLDARRWVH